MSEFKAVESTGKPMREFSTGSVRDNAEGKGRYDLIPAYPLKRLAKHYENGARKYGDNNWRKGQPLNQYLDSAIRHLMNHMEGNINEDHLSAVVWNLFGYMWTEQKIKEGKLPKELNNLDEYEVQSI